MAAPTAAPLDWRGAELRDLLASSCPGIEVQVAASVDSTNTRLLEAFRARSTTPSRARLLVAEDQTGGRGRLGRQWYSTRGASLTFSLAWPLQTADLSGLSLAVGVALAEALDPGDATAPRIALKWPNDLWLTDAAEADPAGPRTGRKLGGILIETLQSGPQRIAIIGIGLNVLPMAVREARSGVAWLQEFDPQLNAPRVLHRVAPSLLQVLREFDATGFDGFEPRYRQRDLLLGLTVRAGAAQGVADGVARNGALRVRSADGVQEIVSGEVSIEFPPHPQPGAELAPPTHTTQTAC